VAGLAQIEAALKPAPGREHIFPEDVKFIQRNAGTAEGIAKIRNAMENYPGAVKALSDMPHYILGLSLDAWASMYEAGVKRHAPEGNQTYENGQELTAVVAKYGKAIAGVKASFYSPKLASRADSRVHVEA
jgi:hypothetical protein